MRAVIDRLVEALSPHAIYLFGSRARGDFRPDSDFDLLVITRVEDGEDGRDFARLRRPLKGTGVDVDLVPVRIDDFTAEMESEISMVSSAMADAKRIYDEKQGVRLPPT